MEDVTSIRNAALEEIAACGDLQAIETVRVKFLGRKGIVTEYLRNVSKAPPEQRPALGKASNEAKNAVTQALEDRRQLLEQNEAAKRASSEALDLSLPGRKPPMGHKHPISQVIEEIVDIFGALGYQVAEGPEVETEYYNFDSLNTPADHPARDLHDTFFVKKGVVLRTQTSPVQMRVMEKTQPPVAIVAPGRVYRVDADATHSPMFVQIEGLLVDRNVTFADLRGTLMHFVHKFYGPDIPIRFRPHYFPFTEPSAELDILWTVDRGNGVKESRWLEIAGCGMVHPEVFRCAHYDYEEYSGFAFGMGIDRIVMGRYGLDSIGYLYDNDLRFLEQF